MSLCLRTPRRDACAPPALKNGSRSSTAFRQLPKGSAEAQGCGIY
ncbi:hypothetical protein AmDm5_2023 [Acetobacter malorum]|nr:hypothetical protein AmDm5_2023 [Acetobacter malorum]